jgi:hypothetical protein
VSKARLAHAARAPATVTAAIPITGATPRAVPSEPWQQRE